MVAQPEFIQHLLDPRLYPHETMDVSLIETHLSWIILTGEIAYKIKKPVNFGFVNFSTLAARKACCFKELDFNQRFNSVLYRGCVPITGTAQDPIIDGDGEPFEYAVVMNQFSQDSLALAMLDNHVLTTDHIIALAYETADIHKRADICPLEASYGSADIVHAPVVENFEHCLSLLKDSASIERVNLLQAKVEEQFIKNLRAPLALRKEQGMIRACHGDMHLGNTIFIDDVPYYFDCIEFNESFRWIDTLADVGFMMMDLLAHGRSDLAYIFLNAYLEHSGDYSGLKLLRYYLSYRAMVRAKVALIRHNQTNASVDFNEFKRYLSLAESFDCLPEQHLMITCGISGTGKTTYTAGLMADRQMIRIRSDVERKRLFGINPFAPSSIRDREALYTPDFTRRTFERLYELSESILSSDWPLIVDAANLKHSQRVSFQQIATQFNCTFTILAFELTLNEVALRLSKRLPGASDADIEVAKAQKEWLEPFSEDELVFVTHPDSAVVDGER